MAAWREQPGHGEPEHGAPERLTVVQYDDRLHWGRGIAVGVAMIAGLILVAIIAVLVLTGTDWGRERVRRFAVNQINGMIHGKATMGRLSGNLLTGMTVHDFAITDTAGKPFIAVESFKGDYSLLALWRKHIWVDGAVVVRPLVVLERPLNGKWNWQRIFPRDTTPHPPNTQPAWGDWLRFTNASVVDGQLIVRTPWTPSEGLKTQAARDSAVRDALGGGSRLLISRVPGGFQKTVQLDSVTASLPLLRLAEPGKADRLLEVSSLRMDAFPFRAPGALIRDLKGVFPFNNDSVWWKGAAVALPRSKATGDGSYVFNTGDMTLKVHSDPANFADMRWVYPRLPDGHGKFDLDLSWKGATQRYVFHNADIAMGRAKANGSFGITLSDTISIHDTNLRFSGLDTKTLEQLIPHFRSPRRGVFAGRASVRGGRHALAVNGDVRFDDQSAGASRVVAVGTIGFLDNGGVQARDLRVQMLPVQVAMARTWYPSLPIGGLLTGSATINGSTRTQLGATINAELRDRGTFSAADGRVAMRLAGSKFFDVDVVARPISLVQVGRFFPSAGLQGFASGPLRLTGSLGDLRVKANLRLPDGGHFDALGRFDLASRAKGYNVTANLFTVNLRTVESKAPSTSLTAHAEVVGRGTALATMNTAVALDAHTSRWDTLAVDSLSVRGSIRNGLADIQRLHVIASHTAADVAGTFGFVPTVGGTLTFHLATDSLGAFNRWLPKTAGSSKPVQPRPAVVAAAVRRAKADSARVARATEMRRAISGAPGPQLVVHAPKPVPADTLSGKLMVSGTLHGNIDDFDLHGRAAGDSIVARGNSARRFAAIFDWTHARTPQSKLILAVDADSLSAMGFAFDTASVRLTYAKPGGHIELAVRQGDQREYGARGDYALYPDRKELQLTDMTFRFDTTYWSMPHPALVAWGGPGLRVDHFELRDRGQGRLYANGLLPTNGVANFTLDVDQFPIGNIADILQTNIDATGVLMLHGSMTGTLSNPAFRGSFGVVAGTYNGATVPDLRGTFGYADRQLVANADALQNSGRVIATADARLPLNLAFTGVSGPRLLPEPMQVDFVSDSVPLELIPQFTDLISNFHGRAAARVSLRGTLARPTLYGAAALTNGSVEINQTGAMIDNITAAIRMANDTVYVDSIVGKAKGDVRLRGELAVGNWREPAFNLFLTASGAELLNNDWGKIQMDAGLALTGPFQSPYLSGAATVVQGVIYAPEPTGRHLIGAGDPALFNVLDTAMASDRDLFPPSSPLIANLRMDVHLDVHRDVWVRNREANVEIYTEEPLTIHELDQSFSITGIVNSDRGEYNFLSKRFQITRGSAMFIGTPDINPTLQLTGEYQVQLASRGTIDIRVLIGGTLKKPTLSLESDAQPPKTQSELLSLLAFGQEASTLFLSQSGSSSIAGSAATMDLFGVGAQVAVRRLASVALGVAVQQVQVQTGRALGLDVFDITPADVPDVSGQGIGNFLTQTRFEAGKYVNPRTFVSAQTQALRFGVGVEHRTQDGWILRGSFEPRIVLLEPNLNEPNWRIQRTIGAFVIREWRF